MPEFRRLLLQLIAYAGFWAGIGCFATNPSYEHHDPGAALIKLTFSHAGARATECRRLSPEEIAALAPNMRHAMDCPRARVPLRVELLLDDRPLYEAELPPAGLSSDGPSSVYQRFTVEPGTYRLTARLRDSRRETGFDYEAERMIELAAEQILVIDFRADSGGFVFLL